MMSFLHKLSHARQAKHTAVAAAMEEIKAIEGIYPPDKDALALVLEQLNQTATGKIPADAKTVLQTTEKISELLMLYPDDVMQRIEKQLTRFYDQCTANNRIIR